LKEKSERRKMPFIDVVRAIYAYSPQSTDELSIEENDLLYVLEKGEDSWWRVKKKISGDDDGPEGLIPENYVEQVCGLC
jgi:actin cytoskeleton-regulatory complex protein SLA1